jgi:hypothetical protein
MKLEKKNDGFATICLSIDELGAINNALNEVCNGLSIDDFENRLGVSIVEARNLLKEVGLVLRSGSAN